MPPNDTDALIRRELRRLAELEPSSGRQAQAKATGLRALLRLEGRAGRGAHGGRGASLGTRSPRGWARRRGRLAPEPRHRLLRTRSLPHGRSSRRWWLVLAADPRHRGRVAWLLDAPHARSATRL